MGASEVGISELDSGSAPSVEEEGAVMRVEVGSDELEDGLTEVSATRPVFTEDEAVETGAVRDWAEEGEVMGLGMVSEVLDKRWAVDSGTEAVSTDEEVIVSSADSVDRDDRADNGSEGAGVLSDSEDVGEEVTETADVEDVSTILEEGGISS